MQLQVVKVSDVAWPPEGINIKRSRAARQEGRLKWNLIWSQRETSYGLFHVATKYVSYTQNAQRQNAQRQNLQGQRAALRAAGQAWQATDGFLTWASTRVYVE